jgi:uncharacterized BrkB/YihY/UPF0761 family membrane protein
MDVILLSSKLLFLIYILNLGIPAIVISFCYSSLNYTTSLKAIDSLKDFFRKNKVILFISILVLIFFQYLITFVPLLILLVLLFFSITPLLFFVPLLVPKSVSLIKLSTLILDFVLKILSEIHVLQLCFFFYHKIFYKISDLKFNILMFFLGFTTCLYFVILRFSFYLSLNKMHISLYPSLFLLFYLSFFCFIFRIFLMFCARICSFISLNLDQYQGILYTEIPPVIEESNTTSYSSTRFVGLFNRHTHHHHYPPNIPRMSTIAKVGLATSIFGVGLGTYACYQYHLSANAAVRSADAAVISANAAVISANAAVRSADAAEVSAGMMSKESFDIIWH